MHVDKILAHGIVVTMNPQREVFQDGALAFAGGALVAVGQAESVLNEHAADEIVDCANCVLMPGLINAHTHVPMTLLRGLADDLRLDVWLHGYMLPVEREFVDPDFVRLGTLLACAEMIRGGVTCFADMYYFEDAVAEAAAGVGMRAVCAETILKFPSPDAVTYDESLEYARCFVRKWCNHPLIVPAVGPHAPYTSTPEILEAAVNLAIEYDVPLHTHLSETKEEVDENRATFGVPPVAWVKEQGLFRAKVIAAHCVHVDAGEMRDLSQAGAGVVHNPTSNLKLASGVAPVQAMLSQGIHVGIGTDGTASNNDLDMFEEMRLAALLAKGVSGDPEALPAWQALAMATVMGAEALHIGDITGSLELGKRADVIAVDLGGLHVMPKYARDPNALYAQLVYAAKSSDVRHTWVNGQCLMWDRRLLTVDEATVLTQAQAKAAGIDAFLIAREGHLLDKLIAIGGLEQQETFEVQVKVRLDQPEAVFKVLRSPLVKISRSSVRRQYDTYFLFTEWSQGRLRYREDEILNEKGAVREVRYSLTLTSPAHEREYPHSVVLSRSRFTAHATQSRRFYREYFKPVREIVVHKERWRYHIAYQDIDFAVNIDKLDLPRAGEWYLEVKSRTWSSRDADIKAQLLAELLTVLGFGLDEVVRVQEYVDLEV
ncbi:MAG: amidohydrolase family protein [Thermoflexales bacterium]|nr:amidohydrolase family protein [Thermoflexales bacterium]